MSKMQTIWGAAIVALPYALVACGSVSNSDPSLWTTSKDIGGTQLQMPQGAAATGAAGAQTDPGAGGAANPTPAGNPNPGEPASTGAGGQEVSQQGAGGVVQGAGGSPGFVGEGSGGAPINSSAGGVAPVGAGGVAPVGAGGMAVTPPGGNSGKCTFTFGVTTVTARGLYAPRNVGAVWITDSSNKFVKTLQTWGTIRLSNATAWEQASGGNTTDAVTGATRASHGALNSKWDCTDKSKNAVPDGQYSVNVTFTETDANPFFGGTPLQASVKFTKSSAPADVTGTDTANFTGMHATLTSP